MKGFALGPHIKTEACGISHMAYLYFDSGFKPHSTRDIKVGMKTVVNMPGGRTSQGIVKYVGKPANWLEDCDIIGVELDPGLG